MMARRLAGGATLLWPAIALLVCAMAGLLLSLALTRQGLPETPAETFYRCWGWYEGTASGRAGAPCPPTWTGGS